MSPPEAGPPLPAEEFDAAPPGARRDLRDLALPCRGLDGLAGYLARARPLARRRTNLTGPALRRRTSSPTRSSPSLGAAADSSGRAGRGHRLGRRLSRRSRWPSARPDVSMTIPVEPRGKKRREFLRHARAELGLRNARVLEVAHRKLSEGPFSVATTPRCRRASRGRLGGATFLAPRRAVARLDDRAGRGWSPVPRARADLRLPGAERRAVAAFAGLSPMFHVEHGVGDARLVPPFGPDRGIAPDSSRSPWTIRRPTRSVSQPATLRARGRHHRDRQPEGGRRQDDDRHQPRGVARGPRPEGAPGRSRSAGQRHLGPRASRAPRRLRRLRRALRRAGGGRASARPQFPNLSLLPSGRDLVGAEIELVERGGPGARLCGAL